jgi:hypothetical protein
MAVEAELKHEEGDGLPVATDGDREGGADFFVLAKLQIVWCIINTL